MCQQQFQAEVMDQLKQEMELKTFRNSLEHEAGKTMVVSELIEKLKHYPENMPVFAEWEGVTAYIDPENFEVNAIIKGHIEDDCLGLVIDVNQY